MKFNRKIEFIIGLKTRNGGQLAFAEVIQKSVVGVLSDYGIDGFSAHEGLGYWKGEPEQSVTVTIYHDLTEGNEALLDAQVQAIAAQIAADCDQECVLYSITEVKAGLAEGVWK